MKFALCIAIVICISCKDRVILDSPSESQSLEAISLLGDSLYAPTPSEALILKYEKAEKDHLAESENPEKLIWYGRFAAYTGRYNDAIKIFTKGIEKFPEDPRFLRHRGHRYISIRQFDKAISDLSLAANLIKDRPDEIEPDGMPNSQNIPVSSLNTNIWYHLGLAYYLEDDLDNALVAYDKGIDACTNDDMLVAFIHWKYMSLRQLGRNDEAQVALEKIQTNMDVIESFGYHKLCQFYKSLISLQDLSGPEGDESSGASEALQYGIANWHLYNGNTELAERLFRNLYSTGNWAGFGYIASEVNLLKLSKHD